MTSKRNYYSYNDTLQGHEGHCSWLLIKSVIQFWKSISIERITQKMVLLIYTEERMDIII